MNRVELGSGLVMALGAAAFYAGNLWLGKLLSPESYGHFGIFLSIITLAYSFGLLGVEQVLLRHGRPIGGAVELPVGQRRAEAMAWFAATLLLTFFFTWKYAVAGISTIGTFLGFATLAGATSLLLRQVSYQRLCRQFDLAQWSAQFWRLLLPLLAALVWLKGWDRPADLLAMLAVSMLLALVLAAALSRWRLPPRLNAGEGISGRGIAGEAFLFSSSLISVSLLAQLDRLILAKSLGYADVGVYVFLLALATGPFALVQSYMGFTLLPKLRHRRPEESAKGMLRRAYLETLLLAVLGSAASLLLYFFLVRRHFDPLYSNTRLFFILLGLGWIRAFYGVVSARLSAVADLRHLASAAVWGWGISLGAIPLAWFLGGNQLVDMAVIVCVFWLARIYAWTRLARSAEARA